MDSLLDRKIVDISHLQKAIEDLSRYLLDQATKSKQTRYLLRKKLRPVLDENGKPKRKPDRTGKYGKFRKTWYEYGVLRDYVRLHPNKSKSVNKRIELLRPSWRDIALYKPVVDAKIYNIVIGMLEANFTIKTINEITGVSADKIISFKRLHNERTQYLHPESTGHSESSGTERRESSVSSDGCTQASTELPDAN